MDTYNSDKIIISRIIEGDEEAFRELYFRYNKLLHPFLYQLTGSVDITSELIQETMLRIWLYRDKLAEAEQPRAYIYRIAANRAHTWLKNKLLRTSLENQMNRHTVEYTDDVHSSLIVKSMLEVVQQAISELPEQRRRIYQLNREYGLKATEISRQLLISVSTVKNALYEAVKYIREQVEKAGYVFPLALLHHFF